MSFRACVCAFVLACVTTADGKRPLSSGCAGRKTSKDEGRTARTYTRRRCGRARRQSARVCVCVCVSYKNTRPAEWKRLATAAAAAATFVDDAPTYGYAND